MDIKKEIASNFIIKKKVYFKRIENYINLFNKDLKVISLSFEQDNLNVYVYKYFNIFQSDFLVLQKSIKENLLEEFELELNKVNIICM